MGTLYFDQYTYLHFAVGIIGYFWNLSLLHWVIFHTIFEILENSQLGIHIINTYIIFWPGGKPNPDTIVNSIGDTLGTILGWVSAYYLDKFGNTKGWFNLHIQ